MPTMQSYFMPFHLQLYRYWLKFSTRCRIERQLSVKQMSKETALFWNFGLCTFTCFYYFSNLILKCFVYLLKLPFLAQRVKLQLQSVSALFLMKSFWLFWLGSLTFWLFPDVFRLYSASEVPSFETLVVSEPKKHVYHVELARPKKLNTFSHNMWS